MNTTGHEVIVNALRDELLRHMIDSEPGHCVRVDGIDQTLAIELATSLQDPLARSVDVFVLRSDPAIKDFEIAPEKAIELRNRKIKALLLLVPAGEGHAASSLDNSFERLAAVDLFGRAERRVLDAIPEEALRSLAARHATRLGGRKEAWLGLLAELVVVPTLASFGRNLWRVDLIPDAGEDVESRLERNRRAVDAISRPSRPAASIDERLTQAGLEEGAWRGPLRQFLDQLGARLASPSLWAEELIERELTFDRWKLADAVHHDLSALGVEPFLKPDGSLDTASKLRLGVDGQLLLEVPDGGPGSIVVQWRTTPPVVDTIAKWRVEVRKPEDLRDDASEPLAVMTPKNTNGRLRRCTLKVEATADDLDRGTMFVVSVTPLGQNGEEIALDSGEAATADSQWFQIALKDAPDVKTPRKAAVSIPEAAVQAALAGQDDLSEDLVMWDLDGNVFGLRLGNRRSVQVRISDVLVRLQREAVAAPDDPKHHVFGGAYGVPLEDDRTSRASMSLVLPRALARARSDFLAALNAGGSRNTGESVSWSDDLRSLAKSYAASYKRALELASETTLEHLLLMDTVSTRIKRADRTVQAVIVLPIHPMRINWIADHDSVLRTWATELTEINPSSARASNVDAQLLSQVVPANLPFTAIDADGNVAAYAEELTFGAGLYLVPGAIDRDSAAETVCSILGLNRMSSTMRASAGLVAERVAAYEAAHHPGETLRVLAVNPGSGELVAGALAMDVHADLAGDTDDIEPHRLEVVTYSDTAGYVRPVPALIELQSRLRSRKTTRRATHLSPPLSLSVRASQAAALETSLAHLAVVQDIYEPSIEYHQPLERIPSFRDLLVPIVTTAVDTDGPAKTWVSYPAMGAASGGAEHELSVVHRTHQRAIARHKGAPEGAVPTVSIVLDEDRQEVVRRTHDRADWVVGLDRYVGVDLFGNGVLESPYILDYAPDFVEGIGDRLTVTTTHRWEVERLLSQAMEELGLSLVNQSVGRILETLSVVSGRLALRLVQDTSRAREAVSLAALMTYLNARDQLDDVIVIPVDAHQEIFGAAVRDSGEARRCDLLLVRISQRSFKIECVEVKSRKEAHMPDALAGRIVEQVEHTRRLLESRFFSDPPRIDADLQRARLASLLHYYADRAFANGLIRSERIGEIHRYIDRVSENRETATISTQGYVISLNGAQGFKKKYGETPMTVITAPDLTALGFTTLAAKLDSRAEARPQAAAATLAVDLPEDVLILEENRPERGEAADLGTTPRFGGGDDPLTPAPGVAVGGATRERHGESVDEAESHEVRVVLGESATGGDVTWAVSTQGSPHAFILGIPGQGKSVTTRKIIRDFAAAGLPSLVFDFHGDMAANPPDGARILDAAAGLPFNPFEPDVQAGRPINTNAMEIAEILAHVAGLGDIQRDNVYTALRQTYEDRGWRGLEKGDSVPTIDDFVDALSGVESRQAGKNAVARLRAFTDFGLFAEGERARFEILDTDRHGLVVDISRLSEEVQRVAASFILRKVYREMFRWDQDGKMKLAIVLDEAHRMARDVTLPKIMKEGRKYGAGMVVASQNVDDFHSDVLGNAGTKIVFRTNFPASKKVSNFLRGRKGADLSQEIEKLNVGVAYVSTPDVAQARRVYMSM